MTTDKERRGRENADLIRRMKAGETLSLVAPAATWWPPRALTKKDPDEIARVYGGATHGTVAAGPLERAVSVALLSLIGNTAPLTLVNPE